MMDRLRKSLIGLVICLLSTASYGFKVDTHVWVAQQVIDDLKDGYFTFDLGSQVIRLPISQELVDTVRLNPAAFRMGNIGPDASPSIMAGQSVIHPGDTGWESDKWIAWIDSRARSSQYGARERAYALGFRAHAAADVFAHTYVNLYSGGHFTLDDTDFAVEARHVLLESFISSYTPDVSKLPLAMPGNFVRDQLILNPTVADQYWGTSVSHLSTIYHLRTTLQSILDSKELDQLEEQMIQYASEALIGIPIPDKLADEVNSIFKEIDRLGADSIDEAQRLARRLHKVTTEIRSLAQRVQLDTINGAEKVALETIRFDAKVADAVVSFELEKAALVKAIGKKAKRTKVCDKWAAAFLGLGPCISSKIVYEWSNAQLKLWGEVDRINESINNERKRMVRSQVVEIKNAAKAVHNIINETDQAVFALGNDVVDLMQRFGGFYPHRRILEGWRDDIDSVMLSYVYANADVLKGTIVSSPDLLGPLRRWLSCESIALVGIPIEVPHAKCTVGDSYKKISGFLDDLGVAAFNIGNPGLGGLVETVNGKIDQELDRLVGRLEEELLEEVVSEEVLELVKLFKSNPTEAALDKQFNDTSSPFRLLAVPQMSARVKTEMALRGCTTFDPDAYAVIANAVTMAKLSVLSAQELNNLVNMAGGKPQAYGASLFSGSDTIFTNAVRTLDGNHQWLEYAPPYPRSPGYADTEPHLFGYPLTSSTGFRIWQDKDSRNKVFRRLFTGPIAPGLESPEGIGFSRVLDKSYPYATCKEWPFPDGVQDKRCL